MKSIIFIVVFIFISLSSFGALEDYLHRAFHFERGCFDDSLNNQNCTLVNGVNASDGYLGTGYNITTGEDFINLSFNQFQHNRTLSWWVHPYSPSANTYIFGSYGSTGGHDELYTYIDNEGDYATRIGGEEVDGGVVYEKWTMLTVAINVTNTSIYEVKFYTNGSYMGKVIRENESNLDYYLGAIQTNTGGSNANWAGLVDEFLSFNRTLSADEIRGMFNNYSAGLSPVPFGSFFDVDNCSDYELPLVNFSVVDHIDNSNIPADKFGYSLTFSQVNPIIETDVFSINDIEEERQYVQFCTNVHGDYTITGDITLEEALYATNVYDFSGDGAIDTSTFDPTDKELTMIKLNESSTVKFNWLSTGFEAITGNMLIYRCLADGTKDLIQTAPIISGVANGNIELVNSIYSYELVVDGVTYSDALDYSKCHTESQTEVTYYVDLLETSNASDILIGLMSVDCNITQTGNFSVLMQWGQNEYISGNITGCIFADRLAAGGWTNIYYNCTTGGSIARTVPDNTNQYVVRGRIYQEGRSKQCKGEVFINNQSEAKDTWGMMGLLSVVFLIMAMMLFWVGQDEKHLIGGGVAYVLALISGVVAFSWMMVAAVMSFILVIVLVGRAATR